MRKACFTLIEVVVALAILGLSITGLLTLLTTSQRRMAKSYEKWERMHMLAQGAEYFMLRGEDPGGIPEEFSRIRDTGSSRHTRIWRRSRFRMITIIWSGSFL